MKTAVETFIADVVADVVIAAQFSNFSAVANVFETAEFAASVKDSNDFNIAHHVGMLNDETACQFFASGRDEVLIDCAYGAAYKGHAALVDKLIPDPTKSEIYIIALFAAKGGQRQLMFNALTRIPSEDLTSEVYKELMQHAALGGHEDLALELGERQENQVTMAFDLLMAFMEGGYFEIAKKYLSKLPTTQKLNMTELAGLAAFRGDTKFAKELIQAEQHQSTIDYAWIARLAAKGNQKGTAFHFYSLCMDIHGALESIAAGAVEGCHEELALELLATDQSNNEYSYEMLAKIAENSGFKGMSQRLLGRAHTESTATPSEVASVQTTFIVNSSSSLVFSSQATRSFGANVNRTCSVAEAKSPSLKNLRKLSL